MKKVILGIFLCLFIIGCGKDYKVYSKEQKREMYDIALEEEKNGNSEKMKEIENLMEKLEIAAKKGDNAAKIELEEWFHEKTRFRSYVDEVKDLKVDLENRRW